MLIFINKFFATVLFLTLILGSMQIFANDSVNVNPEIVDRNGKTPHATYNSCGGTIETKCDATIILEYKPDEKYDNDEFCVWVIRNKECVGALFTKTKSGFEVGYDYLQVSSFSSPLSIGEGPTYTASMGNTTSMEQVSNRGYVYFLIFSTDDSNTGTGFRLEIVGWLSQSDQRWSDDFYTISRSGTTELRPYPQYMMQSFVIAPKHTSVHSLELHIDYFTVGIDYLAVFTMERNGQSIKFRRHPGRRLSGNGNASFVADYYANFVILFYSLSTEVPPNAGVTISWASEDNVTTENYILSN